MDSFTPLERTALDAILAEMVEGRDAVERQLLHAKVLSRENTGGGFYADLKATPDAGRLNPRKAPLGLNVWIGIDGLQYGIGAILHCEDGYISHLEGYAVGPEDTSSIDFRHVQFAIIEEPGPLPSTGS